MHTPHANKNASSVRPPLIYIGTDCDGRRYDLVTVTDPDEIVVRHGGEVIMTDPLHELTPRDVAETVDDEIGMHECRFAEIGAKPVPRKWA
jgi:hypothetical protein